MSEIGKKIKEIRITKKLSQNDLALSLGIKRHTLSAYETGSITPPIDKLILISKYFGVSIDYLCNLDNSLTDKTIPLDTYCLSRIEKLQSENILDLVSCILRYGNNDLFVKAKEYLTKDYNDKTKQRIDEYILIEKLKDTLNISRNNSK